MTEDQVVALRDSLIEKQGKGDSPLAVKFDPMIRDRVIVHEELEASAEEIAKIEAECEALAAKLHAAAIARLRDELANDPGGVGYAGKKPAEIQKLLSESAEFYQERVVEAPRLQPIKLHEIALLRGLPIETIEADYEAMRAREPEKTETVMVGARVAPVIRMWAGVHYARNIPSLDNIAEALR